MSSKTFNDLSGKILVAMPCAMEGTLFYKSLIYIMKHSEEEGAIGLIFNQPFENNSLNELESLEEAKIGIDIHIGGPANISRGFILYKNDSIKVSSDPKMLKEFISGSCTKESLFIIGCTAWYPMQLEAELNNNLWIITDSIDELIFAKQDSAQKWKASLELVGISSERFTRYIVSC